MALDDKDETLLQALERNARASVVDLARQIGLSRSATQERLARLERSGAILGYTVVRGAPSAGRRLRAWVMVRHRDGVKCASVVPPLKAISEVVSVHALAGDPDLLVEVSAIDAADLNRIADRIRALNGVGGASTHVVLTSHMERRP